MYSGKQGGGAKVLVGGGWETGGTCDHYSLNINILGKSAVLHLPSPPSVAEVVLSQPADYWA
jgi:hypothetical protein